MNLYSRVKYSVNGLIARTRLSERPATLRQGTIVGHTIKPGVVWVKWDDAEGKERISTKYLERIEQ